MLKIKMTLDTGDKRALGYHLVDKLKDDEALYFIFDFPHSLSFWNRGVPVDLDVMFFEKGKRLVQKSRLEAQQKKSVFSYEPCQYVLEVNAGVSDKYSIGTELGNIISLD